MTLTERLLNAGGRLQTSKRARKSPCNWAGQKKKRQKGIGNGPAPLGGSCEKGKVSAHWEVPSVPLSIGGDRGVASEPWRRAQQQVCGGQSRDRPVQVDADRHSPA